MSRIILPALFIVFLTACTEKEYEQSIPERPTNVPKNAIWVGGLDGGVFVLLETSDATKYSGEVYYSHGPLSYEGAFKIFPEDAPPIDLNNHEAYQGWDGDTLYFTKGRQLVVIE